MSNGFQKQLENFTKKFFDEKGEEVPASTWTTGHVEFYKANYPHPVGIIEKDDVGWVGATGICAPFCAVHGQILDGTFPGL